MPFLAGLASGIFIIGISGPGATLFLPGIFLAAAGIPVVLLFRNGTEYGRREYVILASLMFLTGVYCQTSYNISASYHIPPLEPVSSPGPDTADGNHKTKGLRYAADIAAEALKAETDRIPFENKECNALVKALISGDRRDLSTKTTSAFRDSGGAHILALSGLHLGMIYAMISLVFRPARLFRGGKTIRMIMICGSAFFYTIMTGASPSTVRALLFIVFTELSAVLFRKKKPLTSLFAALSVQCALDPPVVTSAGFQLSYLAMTGIFVLFPKMSGWFPVPDKKGFAFIMKKIWDGAALSISCQIFTGPLAWYLFGSAPEFFIITNLVAIPLTNIIIPLTAGILVLQTAGFCPGFLIRTGEFFLETLIAGVSVIQSLSA